MSDPVVASAVHPPLSTQETIDAVFAVLVAAVKTSRPPLVVVDGQPRFLGVSTQVLVEVLARAVGVVSIAGEVDVEAVLDLVRGLAAEYQDSRDGMVEVVRAAMREVAQGMPVDEATPTVKAQA